MHHLATIYFDFTLLAVHAHPDDESISTGGVLAKYSAKGTYLHPDHIMANRITLRAFQASADPQFEIDEALEPWQPTKLYYTAIPPERIRRKLGVNLGVKSTFDLWYF